jgi:hypothetical protein
MAVPEIEVSEALTAVAQQQTRGSSTPDRIADKRAAAARANMKKKRAAHRVALRRSHTGG